MKAPWLWLIRFAGLIVPRRLRADWRQEWEAELKWRESQLADWDKLNAKTKLDLFRHSAGAFWDALWLQPRRWEDDFIQDLRYAFRMLRKNPGFSIIAVLTLSLGIGANTAIFSVVNALLLQPLPYPEAERILWFGGWSGNDKEQGVTPADFLDYREQSQSFELLAAGVSDGVAMILTGTGEPQRIHGAPVTANYLDVFGVPPLLGRTFVAEEGQPGREGVVVLSFGLWQRLFGADPNVLNRTFTLNNRKVTVIGVMPRQFQYPLGAELWQPFSFPASLQSPFRSRKAHFFRPIARLKPGVTREQAQGEVETIARRLQAQYPDTNKNQSIYLVTLQDRVVGNIRQTLLLLLGAVGCVLMIACTNVASLLSARATTRHKEIAVRAAMGAKRWRIVRQVMTESLVLSMLGGAGGVLLAKWGERLLVTLSADYLPRANEIHLNAPVFGFALGIAVVTGLLFGLAPAMTATRMDLTESLKEGGKTTGTGAPRHRTLNLLVVAEIALAVLLLIGAGLFVNSFIRLQQVHPGFDESNLLTMRIDMPNPYSEPEKKTQFFDRVHERIATLPGVEAAGLVTELPLAHQSSDTDFRVAGRAEQAPNAKGHADIRNINQDYFRAMRIPILKGRNFTPAEVREGAKVIIISELMAQKFFAAEEPLGQRLSLDFPGVEPLEVIGIVGDVLHRGLQGRAQQTIYFPSLRIGFSNLVIRTTIDPATLAATVRREVAAIDPNQPVTDVKTMAKWASESMSQPRLRTALLGLFSGLALLLSVIGIYGVMAYSVIQRTREIGLRMAVGATASDVLKMVMTRGVKLTSVGIATGLLIALALSRLLSGMLFGVTATDPLTFGLIALVLTLIALMACWIPARRAAKVDPLIALRHE